MKKKLLVLLCACCCIVCILINQPIVYIVFAIAVVLAALNLFVFNKNRFWAKNINNLKVIGRNYDVLVIGEPVEQRTLQLSDNKKSISIVCPGRRLGASKVLAYRLFSLLRPGGTLIVTYHNPKDTISSLDIPYIHDITLLEMGVRQKKKYFPLIFNPISSLKVALGTIRHHGDKTENDCDLEKFCTSRDIKLLTYKV
jgi:hypothetical protein